MSERHLGQTLGKYRIEELIGSGGFAWVYKAFDPELEIHVALKVLKPQFAGDETFEQRFRREAATAAKLRHPNIIKIYSVGRESDAVYFAMDYYPSGLADRLEVSPSLPEEFVVRVGMDVAQALGYAHREGVIHRDIKVDNILFDNHGNAVVADFGIARALTGYTGQTGTNMVVGTPQYFAPEQARAKALDGRADIYSLGVTLYRAATGRLPFEGDDWYEIARQHVEEPPPPPRTVNAELTPGFEAVVLHCLQKHPDDRPATGEALCQELAALLPATLETSAYRTRLTGAEPTVVVRTDSHPTPSTNGTPRKRRAAPFWVIGASLVAAFAVAVPFLARIGESDDGVPPVGSDTLPAAAVPATTPVTPVDSASVQPGDTARRDTVVPAPPAVGAIAVNAPAGATIRFAGREVGTGSWRADSIAPGTYELVGALPGDPACPTSVETTKVTVAAGRRRLYTLSPRPCGTVSFDATPAGATWALRSLTPADSSESQSGVVPANSILLPAGWYWRTVEAPKCASYGDSVQVVGNQAKTLARIRLICP